MRNVRVRMATNRPDTALVLKRRNHRMIQIGWQRSPTRHLSLVFHSSQLLAVNTARIPRSPMVVNTLQH
jgi:hypothetical protein